MVKPTYEEFLDVVSELPSSSCQIAELKRLVEELRRSGNRQAAPFSKGKPRDKPKRPGRKPGEKYGNQAVRLPKRVDETIVVNCPMYCDECEGPVELRGKASQYQDDPPEIKPKVTRFVIHYGRCNQPVHRYGQAHVS